MIPEAHWRVVVLVRAAAIVVLLAGILGCSSQQLLNDALMDRLSGQGPVEVSPVNPFATSNLWLAKEAERSQEVRGFLELKGQPLAVEVHRDFFSAPRVSLYYTLEHGWEAYELEPVASTWVIKGPLPTGVKQMARVGQSPSAAAKQEPAAPVKIPPLAARSGAGSLSGGAFTSPAIDKRMARVSLTALANASHEDRVKTILSRMEESLAEISPKGDLVHYITFAGEHLSLIARWYTLDASNAARLARINQLKDPHTLTIGDQIVIPAYMVRNKVRLSEEAIQELSSR